MVVEKILKIFATFTSNRLQIFQHTRDVDSTNIAYYMYTRFGLKYIPKESKHDKSGAS
jgi:hypothetical protein